MSPRPAIVLGAASGALTVALGAFGAHGLEQRVTPDALAVWETGVHYQGLHALALILWGLFAERRPAAGRLPAWCFLLGAAVFSGTLYAMVLGGPRWLGAVTPVGGVLMIAGWVGFAVSAFRAEELTT